MARIAGVDLPRGKRIEIALTYIFGIGKATSGRILDKAKVSPDKRTDQLDENEIRAIRDVIDAGTRVEGDLRKDISFNIKRLRSEEHTSELQSLRHLVC